MLTPRVLSIGQIPDYPRIDSPFSFCACARQSNIAELCDISRITCSCMPDHAGANYLSNERPEKRNLRRIPDQYLSIEHCGGAPGAARWEYPARASAG